MNNYQSGDVGIADQYSSFDIANADHRGDVETINNDGNYRVTWGGTALFLYRPSLSFFFTVGDGQKGSAILNNCKQGDILFTDASESGLKVVSLIVQVI